MCVRASVCTSLYVYVRVRASVYRLGSILSFNSKDRGSSSSMNNNNNYYYYYCDLKQIDIYKHLYRHMALISDVERLRVERSQSGERSVNNRERQYKRLMCSLKLSLSGSGELTAVNGGMGRWQWWGREGGGLNTPHKIIH